MVHFVAREISGSFFWGSFSVSIPAPLLITGRRFFRQFLACQFPGLLGGARTGAQENTRELRAHTKKKRRWIEMMRLKPQDLGAGWQARHNRNPKHGGLAGTRACFIPLLSKAPGKKIQPRPWGRQRVLFQVGRWSNSRRGRGALTRRGAGRGAGVPPLPGPGPVVQATRWIQGAARGMGGGGHIFWLLVVETICRFCQTRRFRFVRYQPISTLRCASLQAAGRRRSSTTSRRGS
jgi:hypothetical protein